MSLELIKEELDAIAAGGLLSPHAVVEKARDPDSALHDRFTWDDSEAAASWRLEEARRLIRVFVVQPVAKNAEPVRAFVSLTTDRHAGGGYRTIASVLSDDDLRAQMLQDALDELDVFKTKYAALKEMKPVFTAAEKAERKFRRQEPVEPLQAAA